MGFLDKLKGTGVLTDAEPKEGVGPAPAEEVKQRLLAISGKGIQTGMDGDDVVVAWSAKVQSAGPSGAGHEYLYRAFKIELDEQGHEAKGIGIKSSNEAEIGIGGHFSGGAKWERGQHMGSETMHVLAWLGPHRTEGGADEEGYKFAWGDLREQVIEAVTGAGWTYKPKRI
jgi:hypothetical protein